MPADTLDSDLKWSCGMEKWKADFMGTSQRLSEMLAGLCYSLTGVCLPVLPPCLHSLLIIMQIASSGITELQVFISFGDECWFFFFSLTGWKLCISNLDPRSFCCTDVGWHAASGEEGVGERQGGKHSFVWDGCQADLHSAEELPTRFSFTFSCSAETKGNGQPWGSGSRSRHWLDVTLWLWESWWGDYKRSPHAHLHREHKGHHHKMKGTWGGGVVCGTFWLLPTAPPLKKMVSELNRTIHHIKTKNTH